LVRLRELSIQSASDTVGESERRMREALQTVEAVAPCILFIDEIEKGIGGARSSYNSDAGTTARMFGMFLKWLQDRKGDVFVIATANDITVLPPEFARAERWDAVFFVDVPNEEELKELFEYYSKVFNVEIPENIKEFIGYTGAEVKQVCKTASMLEISVEEAKAFVKPLIKTQKEIIERLRNWGKNYAIPASRGRKEEDKEANTIEKILSHKERKVIY